MTQEPQLTMQDVSAVVQIIDLACGRGAVKGEEMYQIGAVRARFSALLEHVQQNATEDNENKEDVPSVE